MKQLLGIVILCITTGVIAQETWSFTFRPTLHFPTHKVLGETLRIGNGVEVTVAHTLGNQSKFYGGMVWNRFDTDEDYRETDIEFIQRGVVLGGMYFFDVWQKQKNPFYVRGALTFMDAKSHSIDSSFDIEADWSIGTQLGMGMKIASFKNWYILPELRYSYISHGYNDSDIRRHLTFGNISITGGVMFKL